MKRIIPHPRRPVSALLALLLTVCCGCSGAPAPVSPSGTHLTVYAFSAGSADAFLLTSETAAVLIDCGEKDFGEEIVQHLNDLGVQRLDCLILTHFDKDHVGGAAKVLQSVAVGRVLQSNVPKDSKAYRNYLEALEETGMTAETVREKLSFSLDGVQYTVFPPAERYDNNASNNFSLILTVSNGADRLLFPGDAEEERIAELLDLQLGIFQFLKVPHHGRYGGETEHLIQAVQPEIAVITSSDEEPEDAATVQCLEQAGAAVYLTKNGPVVIESTGSGINARQEAS